MIAQHLFITRFNLPSQGHECQIRAKENWLRERASLFNQFTVPSVRSQTVSTTAWLVYLDPQSPQWLVNHMSSLEAEGVLRPIYRTEVPLASLQSDIASAICRGTTEIITTNLDNDDGLSVDFVERLLAAPRSEVRTAIYFTAGLIKGPRGLYLRRDRRNAFCSVREPAKAPITCWTDWHNLLHRHMPVLRIGGRPAWMQVIHGSNVSNRVRGRMVRVSSYRTTFGHVLAEFPDATWMRLLRDRLIDGPLRLMRELGRSVVKQAVLHAAGKDGLDRLKLALLRK